MNSEIDEELDALVRDACSVVPVNKSAYRERLQAWKRRAVDAAVAEVKWRYHLPYETGRVAGFYTILERVGKIGKNSKFWVECTRCHVNMFRYANRFRELRADCTHAEQLLGKTSKQVK